ncbi:TonB-dependent receptor [Rubrivirga sp. S365]|uniref:TonB-dependent receptor n=1 Tax=Rubrivirga litoralis TaxID=3075598 RepID=A0ABU3BU61_9BACT|nr:MULTISPECIES: carboxypeptidase-like regulatory domain-containing protein [unclassified Rubrivirga]MDT0632836.1 TonB-dependent receptor [Rubrivirga sp. F394]MDT7855114.1 TonB-dependent receptor [Rubrivirga sp. S365]
MRPTVTRALGSFAVLLAALAGPGALAQTGTVTGTVVDAETGEALPTAAVQVVGQPGLGGATNINGIYEFDLPAGTYTIRATFVGYEAGEALVTVGVEEEVTQDFALSTDLADLEEVIVTGALSERSVGQSEVAVSRLDAEALTAQNEYQDVSQLLNGKISGVSVQPSSGNVGGGIRFNVRAGGGLNGQGQPLIFIDGVRIDNSQIVGFGAGGQGTSALADLNPEDIGSVDVLKGPAAAALYGTDASNGVVLITTKNGASATDAFNISIRQTVGQNSQQTEYTAINAFRTFGDANANFRDGTILETGVSISGGTQAVRYYGQFDRRDEEGILPNNDFDRNSLRANFDVTPSQKLQVGVNFGYTQSATSRPQNDNNVIGFLGNTLLRPSSYLFVDSLGVLAARNEQRTNRFIGAADVAWTPIPALTLRGNVGVDAADLRQDDFQQTGISYPGVGTRGSRGFYGRENDQVSLTASARYQYNLTPRLNLSTAVGVQGFDRRLRTIFLENFNFATPLITDIGSGTEYQESGESYLNERQIGVLLDQSVSYGTVFNGSAGFRQDYATAIGGDSPSIFYPFIRGAFRFDQLNGTPAIFDLLKVRAAYGESGQSPGAYDSQAALYEAAVGGYGAGAIPDLIGNPDIRAERVAEFETGLDVEIAGVALAELTYYIQRATDSIVGVELPPSTGQVASLVPFNVGRVDGQGIEFSLTSTPVSFQNFSLDLGAVFSYQTNEVIELGENPVTGNPNPALYDGFDVNVIRPGICAYQLGVGDNYSPDLRGDECPTEITDGLPRSAFYTTPVNGAVFESDGTYAGVDFGIDQDNLELYQDRLSSGECEYNPSSGASRCYYGLPYPKYNGSFTANATIFRDVSFYALVDYAIGLKVLNNTRNFQLSFGNDQERAELADQLGIGSADDLPNLTPNTPEYEAAANAYARTDRRFDANLIEDADYLKLREISIRYSLNRLLAGVPASPIRTATLTLAGRNLFTSTPYSGVDPEVNFAGARSLSRGQDFLTLQQPRVIYATLTVGL